MNTTSTKNDVSKKNDMMTIKDIENEFDLTHVYVSRAIQKGWLAPASKEPLPGKGDQFRYVVERKVVEAWRDKCEARSRRTDGRRKYNIYFTAEEYDEFMKTKKEREALKEVPVSLANPGKAS